MRGLNSGRQLSNDEIAQMVAKYREVRRRVWNEATRAPGDSTTEQTRNQERLRAAISDVCDRARVDRYAGAGEDAARLLWHEMWTKMRYAGIKARIASGEIASLARGAGNFDDFRMFTSPAWNISGSHRGRDFEPSTTGRQALAFLTKTGVYKDRNVVANVSKLKKTVAAARALAAYVDRSPSTPVLEFLTGGRSDPWKIFDHVERTAYGGGLTAIHLLMDLGFPFVKPDIVLSTLFLRWGWLHLGDPSLPADLKPADLRGEGALGTKFKYDQPRMFRVAILVAQQVAAAVNADDLRSDIGWCTDNTLRELDLFIVKFGQEPEPNFGVVRQLESMDDRTAPRRSVRTASARQHRSERSKRSMNPPDKGRNAAWGKGASPEHIRRRLETWRSKLIQPFGHEFGEPQVLWPAGKMRNDPHIQISLCDGVALRLVARTSRVNSAVSLCFMPSSRAYWDEFERAVLDPKVKAEVLDGELRHSSTPYFYLKRFRRAGDFDAARIDQAIRFFTALWCS
jgi:hypothetical protein